MFDRIRSLVDRYFKPSPPLPAGVYTYKAPADAPFPYRLHLRIENDGDGILILNASTVLHLNQTAVEYAYHLIQGHSTDETAATLARRYRVSREQAANDFNDFTSRLTTLIDTPDLDPITYLDFERVDVHAVNLTAPLRMDCALTYAIAEKTDLQAAPVERVRRELSTEEWQAVLEKAWQAGIPHVIFTGGEPTLRPDLIELIAHAESLGMVTGILTNGHRFAEPKFLADVLLSGLDHLMIVLDENEDLCWEAIRDTLASDLFVTVHLTVHKKNQPQIPTLLRTLANYKVKALSLSTESAEMAAALKEIRELAAALEMTLIWDLPVPYSKSNPVATELESEGEYYDGAGNAWIYVEPDGDVLAAQGKPTALGNLLINDWKTIWTAAKSRSE
ncbi:MAG: PqqD family peptide modification chaperone [Chloroflexota bacterium]|jgi:organic radical activating enzyme